MSSFRPSTSSVSPATRWSSRSSRWSPSKAAQPTRARNRSDQILTGLSGPFANLLKSFLARPCGSFIYRAQITSLTKCWRGGRLYLMETLWKKSSCRVPPTLVFMKLPVRPFVTLPPSASSNGAQTSCQYPLRATLAQTRAFQAYLGPAHPVE